LVPKEKLGRSKKNDITRECTYAYDECAVHVFLEVAEHEGSERVAATTQQHDVANHVYTQRARHVRLETAMWLWLRKIEYKH